MALKLKTIVIPIYKAQTLIAALPLLNAPTVGDSRKITAVLETLEDLANQALQAMVKTFYETHGLPETEEINQTHPLANDWLKEQNKLTVEVTTAQLQIFDEKQLNNAILGRNLSVEAVRVLDTYLVKK